MATVNGQVSWGFVPLAWSDSNLYGAFPNYRNKYICSANDPLRYQVQWTGLNEDQNASAGNYSGSSGDLIRVSFEIKVSVDLGNFETIATIKKTKDLPNRHYETGNPAPLQRFTIDVSSIVSDEVSYSLCPINKGTWQSNYYGGMNGGAVMQDNVLGNAGAMGNYVSYYNVSKNGTYRRLRVKPTFEIINGDGEIVEATGTSLASSNTISVINAVSQFGIDKDYFGSYALRDYVSYGYFLTRSPYTAVDKKKPVRVNEKAEFLQFYLYNTNWTDISGSGNDYVGSMGFKVVTYTSDGSAENTFYIRDFEDNLQLELDSTAHSGAGGMFIKNAQYQNCIQNLSPSYIINKATKYAAPDGSDTIFPYWNLYEVLGSELVTNGSFASDANWTKGTGWTISGSKANCDGTQTGNTGLVQQNGVLGVTLDLEVGKQYKMVIDVTVTAGVITYIEVGGTNDTNDISTTSVSTLYFTPTSTNDRITIAGDSSFVGSVNSVSVKEYTTPTITSSTTYYRVNLVRIGLESPYNEEKSSEYRYYHIDREDDNLAYGFVRFHWLNPMGGIDSYTAKRDVSEGLTISRDVIERKSVDRMWMQDDAAANAAYISDTMRGGDFYKGGREVSNVNAERNLSVYTEPLNKVTAGWLEEMMLSTNVWVEMDTEATTEANTRDSYLRPDDLGYIPVIITNNDVEIVNQEQGLVKFNIEYTLAHKVRTQRT